MIARILSINLKEKENKKENLNRNKKREPVLFVNIDFAQNVHENVIIITSVIRTREQMH